VTSQAADRAGRDDGHRLGGRVVDDREALQHAPFGGSVEDEVGRPDLARR